jgi:hypothetical protein
VVAQAGQQWWQVWDFAVVSLRSSVLRVYGNNLRFSVVSLRSSVLRVYGNNLRFCSGKFEIFSVKGVW